MDVAIDETWHQCSTAHVERCGAIGYRGACARADTEYLATADKHARILEGWSAIAVDQSTAYQSDVRRGANHAVRGQSTHGTMEAH